MIIDGAFGNFVTPAITNSNARTATTAPFDAGSAQILFGAHSKPPWCWFRITVTADASPGVQVDFVGSGESDLDADNSEASNIMLGSSGMILENPADGTVLATGETVEAFFPIARQYAAKRYYGPIFELSGTNPDIAAAQDCYLTWDPQTNLPGAQAAVPST